MKTFITFTLTIAFMFGIIDIAHAEVITAYSQHIDEKYDVDTSTIYNPDKNHINVGVYYTDNVKKKTNPFVFKFQYINNSWMLLEKKDKAEEGDIKEDDHHYWAHVDNGSVAQDILRVIIPYMK